MRKTTKTMQNINTMYEGLQLEQVDILHKTKLILGSYRDVVWSTLRRNDELSDCISEMYGQDLGAALMYLNDFAPTERKQAFEDRVTCLFETKWLIDLIDTAIIRVHDYHDSGKLYFKILSKCYLNSYKYSESEILEEINMERSTYYDRKKEAILLLGIALWGYTIPQLQGAFKNMEDNKMSIPNFFINTPDQSPTLPRHNPY